MCPAFPAPAGRKGCRVRTAEGLQDSLILISEPFLVLPPEVKKVVQARLVPVGSLVITHPLAGTCFRRLISRLRQYRTATVLKVIIGAMPVVRRVAKPFWSSLPERY